MEAGLRAEKCQNNVKNSLACIIFYNFSSLHGRTGEGKYVQWTNLLSICAYNVTST